MKYTLRQLEIFLAVAKYQNISHAAESLHMSQSAASTALRNLEKNYDVALFNRPGKKLELSDVGQTLRTKAEALIEHARKFETSLNRHEEIGHIKIGASFTIGNHLAVSYLADYLGEHPEADVELNVANTPEVVSRVLNFDADIGMIEGEVQHRELELIPWRDDELIVFCGPQHPFAKKGSLTDEDIKNARWILREPDSGARYTFDRALASLMPKINIYLEFKHNEAIKRAVKAELGIGCLSKIVLQDSIDSGELIPLNLPGRNMRRTFYFALPKNRPHKTAVQWWIDTCSKDD